MAARDAPEAVGLDLGGTKILGVRVGDAGDVRDEHRVPTPSGADEIVDVLAGLAERLGSGLPVGVGAAGLVDGAGAVRYSPNIPSLRELPLRARLSDRLGGPVLVDNDANAFAAAEAVWGAARGHRHVLVVTLGTGIGGGIVLEGVPYRGAHGFAAEIGHVQVTSDGPRCACGERGHWEAVASGSALGARARARAGAGDLPSVLSAAGGDVSAVDGAHVTRLAHRGDAEALALVREHAEWVAVGLAGLANILDPEIVVVAGGLLALGGLLLDPVRESVGRRVEAAGVRPAVPIVEAALGERSGAIGASVLAAEVAGAPVARSPADRSAEPPAEPPSGQVRDRPAPPGRTGQQPAEGERP